MPDPGRAKPEGFHRMGGLGDTDWTGLRQAMLVLRRKYVGEPKRRGQDL